MKRKEKVMSDYKYINLLECPMIKDEAAEWFHAKWGVPKEAFLVMSYQNLFQKSLRVVCLPLKKLRLN